MNALRAIWFILSVALSASAAAQYPTKPVRLIVPFSAGSGADLSGRSVAGALSQTFGQQVLVENRAGADGQIAALEIKRSAPDGYTLFWGSASSLSAVPALRKVAPYDTVADFTPLALLGHFTFILCTHPSVPAATARELVAHLRANPGKLNYGGASMSSIIFMASLLAHTKTEMLLIPYKSEVNALPDLLSGALHAMFISPAVATAPLREGKLRAFATALSQRSALAPEVPTLPEAGYPLPSVSSWAGFFAPAGLPDDLAHRLALDINAALARADVREQHDRLGIMIRILPREQFAAFVKEQIVAWRDAIRAAKIPQE